jgi:rhodanese-related sulfurtransferase
MKAMRLQDLLAECRQHVGEIFPWDLKERLDAGSTLLLLDVREPHEFACAHIAGSLSVARGILEMACEEGYDDTVPELAAAREREIVVICRSGQRSLLAARTLRRLGYNNVVSLRTGLKGWNDDEYPLVDARDRAVAVEAADTCFAAGAANPWAVES